MDKNIDVLAKQSTIDSVQEKNKKPLQFMVDPEFHSEFKGYAAHQGVKMSDLFMDMYRHYRSDKD